MACAIHYVANTWKDGQRPTPCESGDILNLAKVVSDLAKTCEETKKPVTCASFHAAAQSL